MTSSAEIEILRKCADLAKRNGLRVSEANAIILDGDDHHILRLSEYPEDQEKSEKYGKMLSQLGLPDSDRLVAHVGLSYPEIKVEELSELEDIVDRALSLAPRARTRE